MKFILTHEEVVEACRKMIKQDFGFDCNVVELFDEGNGTIEIDRCELEVVDKKASKT